MHTFANIFLYMHDPSLNVDEAGGSIADSAMQLTLFRARVPKVPRSTAACVVGHTDTSTIGTRWVADNCKGEGESLYCSIKTHCLKCMYVALQIFVCVHVYVRGC